LGVLTRDLDSNEGAVEYLEAVYSLVTQANEKIWNVCALIAKAHALARKGQRLESHRDLWLYKNEVAKELGIG